MPSLGLPLGVRFRVGANPKKFDFSETVGERIPKFFVT